MARRIDMDDRVDVDVRQSCVTKQTVSAPPDKEINPLHGRSLFGLATATIV
jgi:hypothetical protein